MSRTESVMLDLGTPAPHFELPDVTSGKNVSIRDFDDKKVLLVMFICRHCPYVKHTQRELAQIGKDYLGKSLGIVAISANDASAYPGDGPEGLREQAAKVGFVFPYLYDESQDIARAYTAACTPDFFLFNDSRRLVYRGQLDDSRPNNGIPVTGRDLRAAIDAVLNGEPIEARQKPSVGCNIKWRQSAASAKQ